MNVKEKVLDFIIKFNLIGRGDKVLLGVSGGPDSLFMTFVLNEIRKDVGFETGIATFNHKIRPESKEETNFVKGVAEKLNIPFFYGEEDVDSYANKMKISIEEAARQKRFEFLLKTAKENGFNRIALAHNKDDLAETVLYHIAKGSGLSGLTGIKPKSFGEIIHPILCVERTEIEQYLSENNIPFRTDKTNFLLSYMRNRIRHQIMPLFTSINPSFRENVFYMMQILSNEDDFLNDLSKKDMEVIREGKGYSVKLFLSLPLFEQRRIVKLLFGENASFERVERVLNFLKNKKKTKENFYGNLFVVKRKGRFFIEEENNPPFTLNAVYEANIPGETEIKEANCILRAEISDTFFKDKLNKFTVAFDFNTLRFPLNVRFRRAGDKIVTESGTKKLQDLFVDAKIPYEKRAYIPILTDANGTILWVIGVRRSAVAKISDATKKVLFLTANFKKK